jgi:hypothetical protein
MVRMLQLIYLISGCSSATRRLMSNLLRLWPHRIVAVLISGQERQTQNAKKFFGGKPLILAQPTKLIGLMISANSAIFAVDFSEGGQAVLVFQERVIVNYLLYQKFITI